MHFSGARVASADIDQDTLAKARAIVVGTNAGLRCGMRSSIGI